MPNIEVNGAHLYYEVYGTLETGTADSADPWRHGYGPG